MADETTIIDNTDTRPDWLDWPAWPFPTSTIRVADADISVTDTGEGPTLLLVHVGTWSIVWRDLITDLRRDFRCVTIDPPGSGLSTGRSDGLASAAAAIDEVVRHLDLDDLTLVLHDLGGPAGLEAAARWAERISAIVAVNTFGWRPTGAAFRSMLALMGSAPMRELDALTGWLPRLTSTRFGVGRHWGSDTRTAFRRGMDRRGRRAFHRYMRSVRTHDFRAIDGVVEALANRPALTVFGERNDPLGLQAGWADRLDQVTELVIPGGNHFPMCDAPDLVADALRTWHADNRP